MFNYSVQYRFDKTQELNNIAKPKAIISFNSEDTNFNSFTIERDVLGDLAPSEIVKFNIGKFSQLEIIRENWLDLENRVNTIIAELKSKLAIGVETVNYSEKPNDIKEISYNGITWE